MSSPPAAGQPVTCLVTGATGYVGGRLVPELLAAGHRVRCMARQAGRLSGFGWTGQVEVTEADALDAASLPRAMAGVDVAYYLIHSLGSGAEFEATDRAAAQTFAACAHDARVGRIIYLGGLRPPDEELSPHLRSRAEVGDILLGSGVPTAVLRAGVIIGSGSASFEMLRYLTERLPVMVTPKWVRSRTQPIAIRDVHPGRMRAPAPAGEPGVRHRRAGRADLRGHDAAVRSRGRPAATAAAAGRRPHPMAVQPLGRAHHPGTRRAGLPTGRIPAPRRGRRRARHRPLRARPARRAERLRRRRPTGPAADPERGRGHQVDVGVPARRGG